MKVLLRCYSRSLNRNNQLVTRIFRTPQLNRPRLDHGAHDLCRPDVYIHGTNPTQTREPGDEFDLSIDLSASMAAIEAQLTQLGHDASTVKIQIEVRAVANISLANTAVGNVLQRTEGQTNADLGDAVVSALAH
jgi:hypothetical protein